MENATPSPLPTIDVAGLSGPVTRLGLGCLPMGPLQRGLAPEDGAAVVRRAVERGVRFLDTATIYGTYEHIRRGLAGAGEGGAVTVATKTHGKKTVDVEAHLEQARSGLDRDVLDIVLLHCGREPFDESWDEAWETLLRAKAAGRVRLAGFSTHRAGDARRAADRSDIDVVHPLINQIGLGILDGDRESMVEAIACLGRAGKFVYAMKALAGGHLIARRDEAVDWVLGLPGIDAVALGMVTTDEVDYNALRAAGAPVPEELVRRTVPRVAKRLGILPHVCVGCGACVAHCENDALRLENGRAAVEHERCILCGYCAPHCPLFAIRIA